VGIAQPLIHTTRLRKLRLFLPERLPAPDLT